MVHDERSGSDPPASRTRVAVIGLAIALGGANLGLFIATARSVPASTSEARLIPAGVAAWEAGSFRFADDVPPLSRLIAALPVLAAGPHLADTSPLDRYPGMRCYIEKQISVDFASANLPRYGQLTHLARLPGFLWWALGAWLIAAWAAHLYGTKAALLVLSLWALEPDIIASEAAVDPSMPAAVAGLVAMLALVRQLRRPSWGRAVAAGLALGLAQLVDYRMLALLPIWGALAFIDRWRSGATGGWRSPRPFPGVMAILSLVISVYVINLGYGFCESGQPVGAFATPSSGPHRVADPAGPPRAARFGTGWLARLPVPLPADYVRGLQRRIGGSGSDASSRGCGTARRGPLETIASLAARSPLGIPTMIAWSSILLRRRRPGDPPALEELAVWLPLTTFLALASSAQDGATVEQELVLLGPFAFVAIGKLARMLSVARWRAGLFVVGLTAWAIVGGLSSHWSGHPYLNEAVGGPGRVESQIEYGPGDGGSDMQALKGWLDRYPMVRPLKLAVGGAIDPGAFGIVAERVREFGPTPGYHALDAAHLRSRGYEPFRHLRPIAWVGRSTFLYRLSAEDVDRPRPGRGLAPLDAPAGAMGRAEPRARMERYAIDRGQPGTYEYSLFVPRTYRPDRPHPVILFLHGFGDRKAGEDPQYLKVGLPAATADREDSFDFLGVFPQGHDGIWHPGSEDGRFALEVLAKVKAEYNVDRRRVYLSGASSGGAGVFELAAHDPTLWAAIVPVATSSCNPVMAPAIARIPCWCFHNTNDVYSPPDAVRAMISAMQRAGGAPRYTESYHFGATDAERHNAWDEAYALPELYDWLLQQRLPLVIN